MSILSCPVCKASLNRKEKAWACSSNHSFDIARKGYVNLLLAHQKDSPDPGDTAAMVASRRTFLSSEHYKPLSDSLIDLVRQLEPKTLLDAGCGEGHFLHSLRPITASSTVVGIDISRYAINAAATRDKHSLFVVASTYDLPILSGSADCVLRIMAPGDDAEVHRVLKPNGYYLIVTPGPEHLYGLKQLIYSSTDKNTPKLPLPQGFALASRQEVRFNLWLTGDLIMQLLAMTPYYWSISATTRETVANTPLLETPAHFIVTFLRRSV